MPLLGEPRAPGCDKVLCCAALLPPQQMAVEDIEAMEADAQQKKREAVQREREAQQSVKRRERAAAKITKELKMTGESCLLLFQY